MDYEHQIKLIATDLDGTLLDHQMILSEDNRIALERAAKNDIIVVVATGRSFLSIPDQVKEIKGIKYAVTANGAKIHDITTGELIEGSYISADTISLVWDILKKKKIMLEVFVNGRPYVDSWDYVNPQIFGTTESYLKYFMSSRKPVEDIYRFIKENNTGIENINLLFRSSKDRMKTLSVLQDIKEEKPVFTLTSSFPFNLEIGGYMVDKGGAIEKLCKRHSIKRENVMCIGDNFNDMSMVGFAGIGVAMEDAASEVIALADFVTKSSGESGVAFALKKFAIPE